MHDGVNLLLMRLVCTTPVPIEVSIRALDNRLGAAPPGVPSEYNTLRRDTVVVLATPSTTSLGQYEAGSLWAAGDPSRMPIIHHTS